MKKAQSEISTLVFLIGIIFVLFVSTFLALSVFDFQILGDSPDNTEVVFEKTSSKITVSASSFKDPVNIKVYENNREVDNSRIGSAEESYVHSTSPDSEIKIEVYDEEEKELLQTTNYNSSPLEASLEFTDSPSLISFGDRGTISYETSSNYDLSEVDHNLNFYYSEDSSLKFTSSKEENSLSLVSFDNKNKNEYLMSSHTRNLTLVDSLSHIEHIGGSNKILVDWSPGQKKRVIYGELTFPEYDYTTTSSVTLNYEESNAKIFFVDNSKTISDKIDYNFEYDTDYGNFSKSNVDLKFTYEGKDIRNISYINQESPPKFCGKKPSHPSCSVSSDYIEVDGSKINRSPKSDYIKAKMVLNSTTLSSDRAEVNYKPYTKIKQINLNDGETKSVNIGNDPMDAEVRLRGIGQEEITTRFRDSDRRRRYRSLNLNTLEDIQFRIDAPKTKYDLSSVSQDIRVNYDTDGVDYTGINHKLLEMDYKLKILYPKSVSRTPRRVISENSGSGEFYVGRSNDGTALEGRGGGSALTHSTLPSYVKNSDDIYATFEITNIKNVRFNTSEGDWIEIEGGVVSYGEESTVLQEAQGSKEVRIFSELDASSECDFICYEDSSVPRNIGHNSKTSWIKIEDSSITKKNYDLEASVKESNTVGVDIKYKDWEK